MSVTAIQEAYEAALYPGADGRGRPFTATLDETLLTLNCGSSSLKFAVFTLGEEPRRLVRGRSYWRRR